jgi:hypothetical protein
VDDIMSRAFLNQTSVMFKRDLRIAGFARGERARELRFESVRTSCRAPRLLGVCAEILLPSANTRTSIGPGRSRRDRLPMATAPYDRSMLIAGSRTVKVVPFPVPSLATEIVPP